MSIAQGEPVIGPEGKDIMVDDRNRNVFPSVDCEGGPVVVAAQEGKVRPVDDAEIIAVVRIDGIAARIV
jgi:hypothetical protein